MTALKAARNAQPDLPRALLIDQWAQDSIRTAQELGCRAMVVNHRYLDERKIDAIHQADMKALTYTVNNADRAATLWLSGLDGLITDRIDVFEPQARLGAHPGRLILATDLMLV